GQSYPAASHRLTALEPTASSFSSAGLWHVGRLARDVCSVISPDVINEPSPRVRCPWHRGLPLRYTRVHGTRRQLQAALCARPHGGRFAPWLCPRSVGPRRGLDHPRT